MRPKRLDEVLEGIKLQNRAKLREKQELVKTAWKMVQRGEMTGMDYARLCRQNNQEPKNSFLFS